MAQSTLEKLKQLSPLAAAIAFSASLSGFVQAEDFVVASQEDLDAAVDAINNEGSGTNTITFDASVSGQQLSMDAVYLYDDGELTIDGAGATDLTLKLMDKDNHFGFYAEDSDVSISNVSIVEGGNAGDGYVAYVWGDSELTLDNVHISAASIGQASDEGAIWVENSNATISNSSFSGMNGSYIVGFRSDYDYETSVSERSLTISNTSFESNYTEDAVLSVEAEGFGLSQVNVTLSGLSFENNETNESNALVYAGVFAESYNSDVDDVTLDFALVNSSLTNNVSDSGVLEVYSWTYNTYDTATLNANIANVTMVNNTSAYSVLNAGHYYENTDAVSNVNIAHVTIANNTIDQGGYYGIEVRSDEEGEGELVSVNIINSIITNNTYAYEGESETTITDVNLNAEREISVMNSLIGMEAPEEGEGFIAGVNADNNNLFDVDALLDELTLDKNSGTMVAKLLKGSPALNAGTDAFNEEIADILGVETADLIDQVGHRRSAGSAPDMGAVEKTKSKGGDSGLFGSVGLGSLIAMFALVGLRRKNK